MTLEGKKVAILVADGFEQVEMTEPKRALDEAGATTVIVSPAEITVQGWRHFDKADTFDVDVPLRQAQADDFDALLLPGGVANPDQLRIKTEAVQFVNHVTTAGIRLADVADDDAVSIWNIDGQAGSAGQSQDLQITNTLSAPLYLQVVDQANQQIVVQAALGG